MNMLENSTQRHVVTWPILGLESHAMDRTDRDLSTKLAEMVCQTRMDVRPVRNRNGSTTFMSFPTTPTWAAISIMKLRKKRFSSAERELRLGKRNSTLGDSVRSPRRISGQATRTLDAVEAAHKKIFVRPDGSTPTDSLAFDFAMAEILRIPRKRALPSRKPLFIIGHRRSGTTLLSWLLDSHPAIASLPENPLCRSFLHQVDRGVPFGVMHSLWHTINEPMDRFVDRIAGLIDDVFLDYARRQGKARWACKELFLSSSLDKLHKLFNFEAKFLYIYRHGLDVAFSASESSGIRGIPIANRTSGLDIENYLCEWRDTNEKTLGFARRNQKSCLLIKYEELVTKPRSLSKRIFEFLGLPWDEAILQAMQTTAHSPLLGDYKIAATGGVIDPTRMGYWKRWPPELVAHLGAIANPTLKRLGYPRLAP